MAGDDYEQHFPTPPWSSRHRVVLKHPSKYATSTEEVLAHELDEVRRHAPLARRFRHGERRPAGTYGEMYTHPDDHEHPTSREEKGLVQTRKDWERKQREIEERGGMDAIFKDPETIITIRDLMQMPDYKLLDSQHHAFARFALPYTEDEIKGQEWEGKHDHEKNDKQDKGKRGTDEGREDDRERDDQKRSKGDGGKGDETEGHHEPVDDQQSKLDESQQEPQDNAPSSSGEPYPEDRAFVDALIVEMNTVKSFRNATGKPSGPLKPLDRGAELQLESRISIDDQSTPDNWVPRSQHLLRLTGKHPLNAEPDMSALYAAGMITPTKLHYVRNHGSVPMLDWHSHTLSVYAEPAELIPQPQEFTMKQLAEDDLFDVVEIPVTLACDGNRRGEVNSLKKSGGFSWGASGVSTCLWRGVLVRDVLLYCGFDEKVLECDGRRLYLHYEGADTLSEGKYATSIPLLYAVNPHNDVMIAFGQNGRILHPDHGAPLRSLIPGFVGGRCVKWLKKIWISNEPSTNHYHIWDNRVLPSFITSKETLAARALFHHPDTICNEQVLQSVICVPAHGENILVPAGEDALEKKFTVKGLAYHGGGNEIQKVELSVDGGETWKYCFRKFVENPLRHGRKHWAWVFWDCEVSYRELVDTKELVVRAWDIHKNRQPEHITWNLLGMMNNAWYRVKFKLESTLSGLTLATQHPIAPGAKNGGWMTPAPEDGANDGKKPAHGEKTFTLDEVAKHNKEDDCWVILDDKVYDVSSVLSWHPGGAKAILAFADQASVDASMQYASIHDNYANSKRDECYIGVLSEAGVKAMREDAKRAVKELEETKKARAGLALMPDTFCPAKLTKRKDVNEDTRVYTFELPKTDEGKPGKLGLPICKHVVAAFHFQDQACTRSYTPIRPVLPEEEDGTFDLLVKTYMPTPNGTPFPPGGTMSNYLDVLKEGEEIDIRGPTGDIEYVGQGKFVIEGKEYHFSKINLIAGGSGLTPHWQLIHAILKSQSGEKDMTEIALIDSNKSVDDILMADELERYANEHPKQFKLWHTLSDAPEGWKYDQKRLDEDMMREHLFGAAEGVATFMCGPPGLITHGAVPGLKNMGFKDGETMFGF